MNHKTGRVRQPVDLDLTAEPGGNSPHDPVVATRRYRTRLWVGVAYHRLKVGLGISTDDADPPEIAYLLVSIPGLAVGVGVAVLGFAQHQPFLLIVLCAGGAAYLAFRVGAGYVRRQRAARTARRPGSGRSRRR